MLVEVVASLARKQNNTTLAMEWMEEIQQLSFLTFIPLDDDLARESAAIAASHRLRGSDAVYVAVARRFGAALVTLDSEQAQRAAPLVPVRLPASD
jgi:predicted nucleic acid-binding protein